MPLYIGDYLGDTSRLTLEQHGAYLLLMMDYWRNGPLPDNPVTLARILHISVDAWSMLEASIKQKFAVSQGVWRHKRIDAELAKVRERASQAKAKASKASRARWGIRHDASSNAPSNAPSIPQAMPEAMLEAWESQSHINTKTKTLNPLSRSPVGDPDAGELFAQAPAPPPAHRAKPINGATKAYAEAEEVFGYLNTASGKGFEFRRPDGEITANGRLVLNLLKAGYTGVQLREVVLDRAERWRTDPKMFEFLRPNTLFAKSNFEAYLGEIRESPHAATR